MHAAAPGGTDWARASAAWCKVRASSVLQDQNAISAGVRLLVAGASDPSAVTSQLAGTEIAPTFARSAESLISAVDAVQVDAILVAAGARAALAGALTELRERHPDVPVLFEGEDPGGLAHAVRAALLLCYEHEPPSVAHVGSTAPTLFGASAAMQRVRDMVARAANSAATVLVRGETGTGKELVARAVHEAGPRAKGPFVAVHCAALPESLLESELFGYEKGAFTGAAARKIGRVEAASGGTLFLDEVGEITASTQAKLLRVIQEKEIQRLGGLAPVKVDVRFVAATHRDLEGMVKEGAFREDLFYRLNVLPIWVPPLRARGEDVTLLAAHFCARFGHENGRPGLHLTEGALARIRKMRFAGNVRQLQNLIERLVVLGTGAAITEADLDLSLEEVSPFTTLQGVPTTISGEHRSEPIAPLDESMRAAEKKAIVRALAAAKQNRTKAARLLGISRASLYNKLREHALP